PVTDDVVIGDLESDIANRDLHQAAQRAVEKRDDLERGRLSPPQLGQHIVDGEAGVDDVLDEQDVPALDGIVDVARDAHARVRLSGGEALQVEIVDHERDLDCLARSARKNVIPFSTPTNTIDW